MNTLFVVITDFNGYDQTRLCLKALRSSLYRDMTVLVVDHGTTETTRSGLRSEFPEVVRIEGSPELWWTGATNLGIRFAIQQRAQFIMLLNNDCYVTPETVGTLMALAKQKPEAIIAPVQRDWNTKEIITISPRSCFLLGFPTVSGPRRLTNDMLSSDLLPVQLIAGGRGAVIPVRVLEAVGILDQENLPHYGADHDFFLRARRRNYSLFTATHALVDVDNTRTSLASNPGVLNFREYVYTLRSVRSHRNVRHVAALFRKHYPVPTVYPVGVALYTVRYFLVYLVRRARYLLVSVFRRS